MAVALPEFSDWLGNKLKDLNTDENVFGDYITGILDGDETTDEKNEALQDLLGEIVEDQSINDLCTEIMSMYIQFQDKKADMMAAKSKPIEVDIKLKELADQHCLPTKPKKYTEEEKKIKEAILAQYSQMSDDEDAEGEGESSSSAMQKNTNAYNVAQAEKEKREISRLESQKKKEKDKEDREKQKQMREEKKEKRKTQKGERRR